MALLFESIFLDILSVLLVVLLVMYFYFTRNFNYWKKLGVPYHQPTPFFGNIKALACFKISVGDYLQKVHLEAGNSPYVGLYAFDDPVLLVKDLDLVRSVLVKDAQTFLDRSFKPDEELDPLGSRTLFSLKGQKWKHMRGKISPTFTTGKMKKMFYLLNEVGHNLGEYLERIVHEGSVMQTKDVMARYNIDLIGTCAFGIETNSLKNDVSKFHRLLRQSVNFQMLKSITAILVFFKPSVVSILRLRLFEKELLPFLRETVWEVVRQRKQQNIVRNDFLDLLIKIRTHGKVDNDEGDDNDSKVGANMLPKSEDDSIQVTDDDLLGQSFSFLTAGFETASSTMSYALYELALHSDMQTRLREEISSVLECHDGQVTYDNMQEMPYLDMVVAETLRKYPPLPFLDRVCSKNYVIPGSNVVLAAGTRVFISLSGIQFDPQFYPDPDRFDPERFTDENKRQRPNYTYMPFGEGPRICVAVRFGLMQTKCGLIHILKDYEVSPCKETPIPLVMDPKAFLITSIGQIPLKVKKVV